MRLWLYGLSALVYDWLLYVVWAVIPLRADDLGATPLQLGILQGCSSVVYITMSVAMGRASDRLRRPVLARVACILMVGFCLLLPLAPSVPILIAMMPLLGLAGSFFWPAIQGAIGAEAPAGRLERDIGFFNISWSVGKSIGYFTGGALYAHLGLSRSLLAAAGGAAAVLLLYPLRDLATPMTARPEEHAPAALRTAYLRVSWVANFVVYGVGATIGNQIIKLIRHRIDLGGLDPKVYFGILLGAVFVAQTAAFAGLRSTTAWTYRRWPLYGSQVLLAVSCLHLTLSPNPWIVIAAAPLIGLGLGVGYASSIYYSLHTPAGHGKYSGIHEAILGAGGFLVPIAAGALAGLDLRGPYWLCGLLCLGAVAVEEALLRTNPTTASNVPAT